jgi:hypothetical protein
MLSELAPDERVSPDRPLGLMRQLVAAVLKGRSQQVEAVAYADREPSDDARGTESPVYALKAEFFSSLLSHGLGSHEAAAVRRALYVR